MPGVDVDVAGSGGLINDVILRAGILSMLTDVRIVWFNGITIWDIIMTYIFPLTCLLALAVYLKLRYNRRREREAITLSGFLC